MEQLPRDRERQAPEQARGRDAAPTGVGARTSVNLIAARFVAAALVVATGAIHLYLYRDGFSVVPTIGRLFLANFVVGVVLGLAILLRGRPAWSILGAGFCLGTLGGFLISIHWGLFGYQETLSGAWQERAAVVEIAGAIACAIVAAWAFRARPRRSLI
ncbi:MAG TPA: hypothetical protein VGJ11_10345 [Gaiellales bacterium]